MQRGLQAGLIAAAVACSLLTPVSAQDYYAGKTIDLVVGNYPGGGFDIYARAVARHLGRNIPGNPAVVVKNMPGAGSAKAQKPEWIRDGKLNFLLQIGPHANDELTKMGVPPLSQYIKDDDSRRVAELIVSQQAFQRPYFVAIGTPDAYLAILRKGFDATMQDEQFLADAKKLRIDVSPLPGATVQDLVQKFYATPRNIVEQGRRAIRP